MQIEVPAYKFTTKSAAIDALNSVNERFGFTFDVSGYDERVLVKKGRYYYIPKDEYTQVLSESKEETFYEIEFQEFEHDNGQTDTGLVDESPIE